MTCTDVYRVNNVILRSVKLGLYFVAIPSIHACLTIAFCIQNFRDCFLPVSELSGKVSLLGSYLNTVFPDGALFLVASETEVKRLFMHCGHMNRFLLSSTRLFQE